MKPSLTNLDRNKNLPRLIEWAVFLGFCAAAAWCFWFYYDTTQKIEKTAAGGAPVETNVNEKLWEKVTASEEVRANNFLTPPNLNRDPF